MEKIKWCIQIICFSLIWNIPFFLFFHLYKHKWSNTMYFQLCAQMTLPTTTQRAILASRGSMKVWHGLKPKNSARQSQGPSLGSYAMLMKTNSLKVIVQYRIGCIIPLLMVPTPARFNGKLQPQWWPKHTVPWEQGNLMGPNHSFNHSTYHSPQGFIYLWTG